MLDCDSRNIGSNPIIHHEVLFLQNIYNKENVQWTFKKQILILNNLNRRNLKKINTNFAVATVILKKKIKRLLKNFLIYANMIVLFNIKSNLNFFQKFKSYSNKYYYYFSVENFIKNKTEKCSYFFTSQIILKNKQLFIAILSNMSKCLLSSSTGALIQLNIKSKAQLLDKVSATKKLKKLKSSWLFFIQTCLLINSQISKLPHTQILELKGSTKYYLDFLLLFEHLHLYRYFQVFILNLKKSNNYKHLKRKKAIKRRLFQKLLHIDLNLTKNLAANFKKYN